MTELEQKRSATVKKRIAFFCIPAHGHTNPMLPVAGELVRRGHTIRFYSFGGTGGLPDFSDRIRKTGAEFVPCDTYMPAVSAEEVAGLKRVSITEMTVQSIRITLAMDAFLDTEFKTFRPDVVYTDSACFWGKLSSWKHHVPMVVSTSTFAFNQLSSQYMKHPPAELADMIFGLPRIGKTLRSMEPYGYKVKNPLSLVQSDNRTDSVVYTSRRFQPYAGSFSGHYAFVGPSVFSNVVPDKKKARPLVYISMGTVINDRPDFYGKCFEALKDLDADVLISCGNAVDREKLGVPPGNFELQPYVDQLDVLSRADVFITHCGMNSVSESLYMATPMVLYPQTGEQFAVAKRAAELGAGVLLKNDSVGGIRAAVQEILDHASYRDAAEAGSRDFRSCSGPSGAADFIESAPHQWDGVDILKELNKTNVRFQIVYWSIVSVLIFLAGFYIDRKYLWLIGLGAGIISKPIGKRVQNRRYARLVKDER
jgi:MGT family glycosyltransferase